DEVRQLGREDYLMSPWGFERMWPCDDWWICEVALSNPRGTARGWNKVHEIVERILLALRCFKSGRVGVGMATSGAGEPFGRFGATRGGRLQYTAGSGEKFKLSHAEIPRFITLWKRLRRVLELPHHFLQVPARRLRLSGTRLNREDALIDYVVGLEALLGT